MRTCVLSLVFVLLSLVSFSHAASVTQVSKVSTDGGTITITGSGFQLSPSESVTVVIDTTNQMLTCSLATLSDTKIVCDLPPGVGGNLVSTITQSPSSSWTVQFTFSFEAPVISSILPTAALASGDMITISGDNFGSVDADVKVLVAGLVCGTPRLISGVIICDAPAGVGSVNNVTVNVGYGAAVQVSAGFKVKYGGLRMFNCGGQKNFQSSSTAGGQAITICGNNLKVDDAAWIGSATVVIGGVQATISSWTSSQIVFVCPEGAGGNIPINVNINGQAVVAAISIDYPSPAATGMIPSFISGNKRAASSGYGITVLGSNFGPNTPFYASKRNINLGTYACGNIQWISTSMLACVLPPDLSGANLALSMGIGAAKNDPTTGPVMDTSIPAKSGGGGGGAPSTPAGGCNYPQGAPDALTPAICNCFSGYGPSDESDTDCAVKAICPGQVLSKGSAGTATPSRPHSTFEDDRLTIVQTAPIVRGRRDYHIKLTTANQTTLETCNYPGPIWRKTLSSLDCYDVYTLDLAWSQNGLCGFAPVAGSDPSYVVYRSTMTSSFREVFTSTTTNQLTFRSSTVTHYVTVKFQRTLQVAISSVNLAGVASANSQIDIVIVDNALYDPETKDTFITFDTSANSPFQLDGTMPAYWTPSADNEVPANADAVLSLALMSPQPAELQCSVVSESCTQRWVLQITTVNAGVELCNLKGRIDFEPHLLCRLGGPAIACPAGVSAPANISIAFAADTDLCQQSSDDVQATNDLTFGLASYEDVDLSVPQSTFQPSEIAHFVVSVIDPQGTIDSITVSDVTISSSASTDNLYHVDSTGDITVMDSVSKFNLSHEIISGRDAPLAPNTVGTVGFQFTLNRHLPSLTTLMGSSSIALDVSVTCEITYHGNEKRSVVVAAPFEKSATLQITLVTDEAAETQMNEAKDQPDANDVSFSAASPVSFATVFAVVALSAALLAL